MSQSAQEKTCFVIMPFSKTVSHSEKYWTDHFHKYLKKIIEEVPGVKAFRSQASRGAISSKIILDLIQSDIVVADLTDHNANVFWELGVRHSFKNGTIAIAQEGTRIPFDIKDKGVLFYDVGHLNEQFEQDLLNLIIDCCKNPGSPDSPILQAISGRGTIYQIVEHDEILRKMESLELELGRIENVIHLTKIHSKLNKDIRDKKTSTKEELQFPLPTIVSSSLDLLITTRYIDKGAEFYDPLIKIRGWLNPINERLSQWPSKPTVAEKWFERYIDGIMSTLFDVMEQFEMAYAEKKTQKFV